MTEILHSIVSNSKERLKNPFLGAFITSWIAFNWQPIFIILFSNKTIEDKITFVNQNFIDPYHLLYFPLISTVIYIIILPYINLVTELLIELSKTKRNKLSINSQKLAINNKKELAIEEIKLEESKTEFRERNSHNQMIESLQNSMKDLEKTLLNERNNNSENIADLNKEIFKNKEIQQQEINQYKTQISKLQSELNHSRQLLFDYQLTDNKSEKIDFEIIDAQIIKNDQHSEFRSEYPPYTLINKKKK